MQINKTMIYLILEIVIERLLNRHPSLTHHVLMALFSKNKTIIYKNALVMTTSSMIFLLGILTQENKINFSKVSNLMTLDKLAKLKIHLGHKVSKLKQQLLNIKKEFIRSKRTFEKITIKIWRRKSDENSKKTYIFIWLNYILFENYKI